LSVLASFIYIKGIITTITHKKLVVFSLMRDNKKGKQNGYTYTNQSVKIRIDNNEFVKNVRKKLMEGRLKKPSSNKA